MMSAMAHERMNKEKGKTGTTNLINRRGLFDYTHFNLLVLATQFAFTNFTDINFYCNLKSFSKLKQK